MAVPLNQGVLNLLRSAVIFADYPALSITSPFLAKGGISVGFEGVASKKIATMTGAVDSPEPYVMAVVEVHILRTQALAAAFKSQVETNTSVGSINVISDSALLPLYQIEGCIIENVPNMTFDGNDPTYTLRLRGIYNVNSELWTAA